jgi:hypothetical protein
MSEEQDIREAAAAGAAAAVDAIVEEQHEDERRDAMETATAVASGSAQEATEHAETAAQVATEAVAVASEAHAEASTAEATAEQAAAEAVEARSEVEQLREHLTAGFSELREFIVNTMAPKPPSEEPTEVIVSHDQSRQDTGENRTNTGSGEVSSGEERPYRHRFGRSRG